MFIYSFLWDFMQRLAMFLAYVYISELTGQRQCVFFLVKSFPRPAASPLWWTLAPMTTCHRHQRPRRRGIPPPALCPVIGAKKRGGAGLSASVPSFLLPSGQYATCHRILPFLPPALGHYAGQTAPRHNEEQATGVQWLGWTATPSTSPETPAHLTSQS